MPASALSAEHKKDMCHWAVAAHWEYGTILFGFQEIYCHCKFGFGEPISSKAKTNRDMHARVFTSLASLLRLLFDSLDCLHLLIFSESDYLFVAIRRLGQKCN